MGLTQGLLSVIVADATPPRPRSTAFAIYDALTGGGALAAGVGAGAALAGIVLLLRPMPRPPAASP